MPLTLADAARLSNDTLRAGVMETFVRESPVLRWMPFIEVLGNGLTYNRENAMATAAFFDVGESWTEDAPTFTQLTATLRILGGDADVDNFLARTRSNYQDLVATVIELKAKAVAHEFETAFIYGNEVVNPKQFDGLHRTIPSMQRVHVGSGATPAPLSLTRLDELIDLIRPGKPDLLIMSRRTRRLLAKFSRAASGPFMQTVDEYGQMIDRYQGIPVAVSDFVTDTETIAGGQFSGRTGGAATSVFALRFGDDGVVGIQGSDGITVDAVGSLETRDASRYRVKWYCNYVLMRVTAAAKIDGISSGDVVA